MPCTECSELSTHTFRSPDDLIHALGLAAEEANRGVLSPIEEKASPGAAEAEAIYSALEAGALPRRIRYRFRCTSCGDCFSLTAEMTLGTGCWTREANDRS